MSGPKTFVAAWRHIVTIFRGEGAKNVTWLWTINQDPPGTGPGRQWWPGAKYVTWVGIDGYYFRPSDTFGTVFGKTIQQVRAFTDKPILLSETAVSGRALPGKLNSPTCSPECRRTGRWGWSGSIRTRGTTAIAIRIGVLKAKCFPAQEFFREGVVQAR